jgi:hypothetical protein
MIRCRSCHHDITRLLREKKARAVARREETFTFRCPHCETVSEISIDEAGELPLILENGGLRTPSFFDVMFADPATRRALWGQDHDDLEEG